MVRAQDNDVILLASASYKSQMSREFGRLHPAQARDRSGTSAQPSLCRWTEVDLGSCSSG